ncbi:FtsK/SpoIIIE domain-containing protein [Aliarcobacter butzleri]|uniref:FtsK/SpoIIIE domain-containing protein n=1 Tax=Aliarcobacter butzleri TaxID=28197 RepID=UPI003AF8D4EC
MGTVDFFIRNCLIRSSFYFIFITLIFILINIHYQELINPFNTASIKSFIHSNSLIHNINIIFNAWENINKPLYNIVLWIGLIIINIKYIIQIISFHKEINMPYSLNFFNPIKQFEWQNKQTKTSHDRFFKHTLNSIYYKNPIAINIEKYENSKDSIIQYLKLPNNYEIDIKRYKNKAVEIKFFILPTYVKFDATHYKIGYINIGYSSEGAYYIKLLNVTHLLVCGESGSGKSNLMHHLLKSIFLNIDFIESIEMIDLKGTELYRYVNHQKVNFIDTVEELRDRLIIIKQEMNNRFKEMKNNNDQLFKGKYIFIVFDEIGSVGTHPDKKLRDEIFSLLIQIFQKGRASKIIGQLYAQKITADSIASGVITNCQSKILMKTDSDFNINNSIGTKESIKKITRVDPDEFPKGRFIYKDGISSEKILIQSPIINFNKEVEM